MITSGEVEVTAVLENTDTANLIWDALPIEAAASTWGDEIYFSIDVFGGEDDVRETVGMGDVGFWPPGHAFCLFFGPTPDSRGDEIRPASPVNVIGRIDGDPRVLKPVRSGSPLMVRKS